MSPPGRFRQGIGWVASDVNAVWGTSGNGAFRPRTAAQHRLLDGGPKQSRTPTNKSSALPLLRWRQSACRCTRPAASTN